MPYTVVMGLYLVVKKNEIMTYAENEWQQSLCSTKYDSLRNINIAYFTHMHKTYYIRSVKVEGQRR